MSKDKATEYNRILEDLRHLYKQKYGIVLDDEILYLIIRINELQSDVKKEIKVNQKIPFRKGIDYLLYGVGKTIGFLFIGIALNILVFYDLKPNHEKNLYYVIDYKGIKTVLLRSYNYSSDTLIDITTTKLKKK